MVEESQGDRILGRKKTERSVAHFKEVSKLPPRDMWRE
jgi:hypothetical protein